MVFVYVNYIVQNIKQVLPWDIQLLRQKLQAEVHIIFALVVHLKKFVKYLLKLHSRHRLSAYIFDAQLFV